MGNVRKTFVYFLAIFFLTSQFIIPTVFAKGQTIEGAIVINADGSISPNNNSIPIEKVNNTYLFTGDIYGSIGVECNNVVIDGNGFSINLETSTLTDQLNWRWNGSIGLHLCHVNNVTITNLVIKNFHDVPYDGLGFEGYGIFLDSSTNVSIYDNTITGNDIGVKIRGSNNNNIYCNCISNNSGIKGAGIWIGDSSNSNSVFNNSLSSNENGVFIINSNNNIVYFDDIRSNTQVGIWANSDAEHNIFYLNNFMGNLKSALVLGTTANSWDNGTFGNYWSDYQIKYPKACQATEME